MQASAAGAALPALTASVPLAGARFIAPLPQPRRNLFCVGRNYHAHAKELRDSVFKDNPAEQANQWPIVFTKVPETVIGPGADVQLPGAAVSSQIDYEAELTVVIGRGGRNIGRAEALSHVYGYTIVNDVTARDVQMRHAQWDLGKSFDTFCPMGPWIVTADAFDGSDTRVRCWVTPAGGSAELRQDARTSDLIFPTLVAALQCRAHHVHIANAFKTEVDTAIGHLHDDILNRLVEVLGVDAIGRPHRLWPDRICRHSGRCQ